MPTIPTTTPLGDLTSDSTSTAVKTVLEAKYADAGNWANWASSLLNTDIAKISNLLGTDVVGSNLSEILTAINAIELYTPPSSALTYTAPTTPSYDTVPEYTAPTLGSLRNMPDVETITIGDIPSTDLSYTESDFSDTVLTALKTRIIADINTYSTGLGADTESALFGRETTRQGAVRAKAYDEITSQFSSREFDMPPGAMAAKITEANNESSLRLADSSSAIMKESAELAIDYNKSMLTISVQLLDVLSKVHDNKMMRIFEAAKTQVVLAIEGFKQTVSVAIAKADLNKAAITSTIAYNEGLVEVFKAEVESQIEPMKAIVSVNQAKAIVYESEVKAAVASLQAQTIPEELKIKGIQVNGEIAKAKASLVEQEAALVIETAIRQLQLEVSTLQGLAQSAAQMIASALNSVNVSSSLGYSANSSFSDTDNENIKRGDVQKSQIVYASA